MMKLPEITIKSAEEGVIEIAGELAIEEFANYRTGAVKVLGENAKLDGFRPGHIPEKILVEKLGEEKILWEMAETAISELYSQILTEKKISALGRPEVTITKLAKDNPLGFKIKTALMPEIKLGDYKGLGGEASRGRPEASPPSQVTDEEVEKVLEEMRKSRAKTDRGETLGSLKDSPRSEELPELNDDFAKSIGKFETLAELKDKIRENLELEKKHQAQEKKRLKIIDGIIEKSEIKIAPLLIESEKEKMLAELEAQIAQMGLKFDDYLSHLKKTREELKKNWDKEARQRVAFGLVLGEIANLEKITAPAEELNNEVNYLKQLYKDVDETRLRSYASGLIVNEKVFEFLEKLS